MIVSEIQENDHNMIDACAWSIVNRSIYQKEFTKMNESMIVASLYLKEFSFLEYLVNIFEIIKFMLIL